MLKKQKSVKLTGHPVLDPGQWKWSIMLCSYTYISTYLLDTREKRVGCGRQLWFSPHYGNRRGSWPFSGTGEGQKCWGASINRKIVYQRSFCTCGDHKVAVLDPNDVDLQLSEASQGKELHNYVIIFGTLIDMVNDNKRRVMNSWQFGF